MNKSNKVNNIFNIGYNTDSMYISEALVLKSIVDEGYTYPIDDLEFKNNDFNSFIEKIHEKYNVKTYDFSDSKKSIFLQYKSEELFISASGNSKDIFVSINCKNIDVAIEVFNLYKFFYKENTEVKIYITTYYTESGRTQNSIKVLPKEEINSISDSYYPYLNNDVMYKQFFNLQENILLLAGKPGIGKSKMASSILKYATENTNIIPYDKLKDNPSQENQFINVCYVKSQDVLCDDSFWRDLESKEFDFVILDDLDYFLTSRNTEVTTQEESNKNKFLNQFLSFTDGIENHKTKFIITTNQPFEDIDSALLRKGRLFDILELRDLSREEALIIWEENNLLEYDFLQLYGKCDRILPADLGSEISKRLNTKIDVALESYCTEDSISKIQKVMEITEAGF